MESTNEDILSAISTFCDADFLESPDQGKLK